MFLSYWVIRRPAENRLAEPGLQNTISVIFCFCSHERRTCDHGKDTWVRQLLPGWQYHISDVLKPRPYELS